MNAKIAVNARTDEGTAGRSVCESGTNPGSQLDVRRDAGEWDPGPLWVEGSPLLPRLNGPGLDQRGGGWVGLPETRYVGDRGQPVKREGNQTGAGDEQQAGGRTIERTARS